MAHVLRKIKNRILDFKDDWCQTPPLLRERNGKVAFGLVTIGLVLIGVGGTILPNVMIPESFNAEWHAKLTLRQADWGCEDPTGCKRMSGSTKATYWKRMPPKDGNAKTWEFVYGASRAEDIIARSPKFVFHIWHVLNPREVAVGGGKPRLQQRGPYAYARVMERTQVFLSTDYVQYKETSFLSPIRGEHRGLNGTDACKVLHAQLGRRAGSDDTLTWGGGRRGANPEPAACADDSEEVTVLNLAFLKMVADCPWARAGTAGTMGAGRCSARRALQHLFGRIATEVWGQQQALLGKEGLVKLLRVHRAPRMLAMALRNARLLKAPWVLMSVMRQMELNFVGASSVARSRAEGAFRGQTGGGNQLVCGWVNMTVGGGGDDDPATPRAGLGQPVLGGEGWLQPRTATTSSRFLGDIRIQTSGGDTDWGGWTKPHSSLSGAQAQCRITVLPQCDYLTIGVAGDGGVGGSLRSEGEAAVAMRSELDSMVKACKAKVVRVRQLCTLTKTCAGALLSSGQAQALLDGRSVALENRAKTESMPMLPRPVVAGDGSLFGGGLNGVRRWVAAAAFRGSMAGGSFAGGPGQRMGVGNIYYRDYNAVVTMMCALAGLSVNATNAGELCALQTDLVLHSVFGAFGYADVGWAGSGPMPAYLLKTATAGKVWSMAPSAATTVVDPASWAEHPLTHASVAADISTQRSLDYTLGSRGSAEEQRGRRMPCVWRWDGAAAVDGQVPDVDTAVRIGAKHDGTNTVPRCSLEFAPYSPHVDPIAAAAAAKRIGVQPSAIDAGRAQLSERATLAILDANPRTHGELSFFYQADGFVLNASHAHQATAWRVAAQAQGGALAPGLRTLWLPAFAVCDNERNFGISTACAEMGPGRQALARLTALVAVADNAPGATDEAAAAAAFKADRTLQAKYEAQVCAAAGMVADLAGTGTAPITARKLPGVSLVLAESSAAGFAADVADTLASVPGMELRRSAAAAVPPGVSTTVVRKWPVLSRLSLQQLGYAQFGSGAVSRMLLGVDSVADVSGISAFLAGSRSAGKQGVLGGGDGSLRAEFPAAALRMGWMVLSSNARVMKNSDVPGEHLGGAWTLRRSESELLLRTLSGEGRGSLAAAREVNAKLAALGADIAAAISSGDAGAAMRACAANVSHLSDTVAPSRDSKAMREEVRPLLQSSWSRDHVPVSPGLSSSNSSNAHATMPFAISAGDNCTRGGLLATMADSWVRNFIETFSCPGYTLQNNSMPRERCSYRNSGMFISLQARRFLFDGYVDPFASFLTQRDIARTESTMVYQCRNAKRFIFRTTSFAEVQAAAPQPTLEPAVNGSQPPLGPRTPEVDPHAGKVVVSMAAGATVPAGWAFGNDDRCRPIYDLDCSDGGYEITVPEVIRIAAIGHAWEPMVIDRDNEGASGGVERQSDLYFPLKDEWFMPEIVLPTGVVLLDRIGGASRKFTTARVVSPVHAAFLGATNSDTSTQSLRNCQYQNKTMRVCDALPPVKKQNDEVRNQQCFRDVLSRPAPAWPGCSIRVNPGLEDASKAGRVIAYRGGSGVSYLSKNNDNTGAPPLGDVYANGWQGQANAQLWAGFTTLEASRSGVADNLPHKTLRYFMQDAMLDKDGDLGGTLPLDLPFDGVHTQAYSKGDAATGAQDLKFLAEVDMHRYCMTKAAWAGARGVHDASYMARGAVATAQAEGNPRVPVPLGMVDLEPTVGWPLVLSLPFFLGKLCCSLLAPCRIDPHRLTTCVLFARAGDEQWDPANNPAKHFDFVSVGAEDPVVPHQQYHNSCYFHEPITGRFLRMEQRTQVRWVGKGRHRLPSTSC